MNFRVPGILAAICLPLLFTGCGSDDSPSGPAKLGTQTGSITVDTATGAVTVNKQPKSFTLSGSAVLNTDTLTVTLDVDSNFKNRVIYNPKVWLSNISDGTFDTSGSYASSFEGVDYMYYGPAAMEASAAATSRDIVLNSVTAGTVTMDISITDSPMLLSKSGYYPSVFSFTDSATGLMWYEFDCGASLGYINLSSTADGLGGSGGTPGDAGCGALHNVVASKDGTRIYAGTTNHPSITVFDTATLTYTGHTTITSTGSDDDVGSVTRLEMSKDGKKLYALLINNNHAHPWDNQTGESVGSTANYEVVEVDASTMTVNGRTAITGLTGVPSGSGITARSMAISPDSTKAAVVVPGDVAESGLYLVDLSAKALIDTDAVTSGVQPIAFAAGQVYPKRVTFADNDTVAVIYGGYGSDYNSDDNSTNGDVMTIVELSDYSSVDVVSTMQCPDNTQTGNGDLVTGPDGMLYWTRTYCNTNWEKDAVSYTGSELMSVIDPVSKAETLVQLGEDDFAGKGYGFGAGIAFSADGKFMYVSNGLWNNNVDYAPDSITKIDMSDYSRVDFDGDTTDGIVGNSDAQLKYTAVGGCCSTAYIGHGMSITPF